MTDFEKLFSLLEERLVQLNHNKEDVQGHVQSACPKILEGADFLEEKRLVTKSAKSFSKTEKHTFEIIGKKLYYCEGLALLMKEFPFDKPLVRCLLRWFEAGSIELISEKMEGIIITLLILEVINANFP